MSAGAQTIIVIALTWCGLSLIKFMIGDAASFVAAIALVCIASWMIFTE